MIGQIISHYKIVEKLGEGGMGVVYKAQDTKLLRSVALKFLAPEMTRDQDAKKRFIQEAQAASALDHPNIAVVHAIDETNDGRSFICMAYYEGQTLKDKITSGPLSIQEAVHIAVQIANGLQRAHESGIVHRDIKPGNIMITPRGEVKIVDFGLAKLAAQSRPTRTAPTAGTAAYMSPEQVLGAEADSRSDLFSLGVLLYEAAAGKRPFVGEHEPALFYSIANADPLPPSVVRAEIPQELERIILRLLEKDPTKRYQSAAEVRADLKKFLGEAPTPRPVIRVPAVLRGRLSLPIAISSVVLIVAAVLFASGALQKWFGGPALPDQKHIVVLPFTNIGGDSSRQAFCDGLVEMITSKLAQLRAPRRAAMWVVATSEARKITSAEEAHQRFGVTLAVAGTVQYEKNQTRVTLNLLDAKTKLLVGSSIIDSRAETVFELQDRVVAEVAKLVEIEFRPEELRGLSAGRALDSKAYELYLQGRGYLYRYEKPQNINSAIDVFEKALRQDTSYALAYAGLGEAYWRKYEATRDPQWIKSAMSYCKRALELGDALAPVHITMGLIQNGGGRYEEAVEQFERALAIDSLSSDAYRELAKAYQALNDTSRAEETYKKAIGLNPGYWAGYNNLGAFYYSTARYAEAATAFRRVTELTPDNYRAYNNLGGMYFYLGRQDEARMAFERSITIEPKNYVAYSQLGTLYFYQGRYTDAAEAYETALKLRDTDYRIWGFLGSAYQWSGVEVKKVEECFRKAIAGAEQNFRINPRDPKLLCELSEYYAMVRDRRKAMEHLQRALVLAPDNVVIMGRAGSIYEELGDRTAALKWIEKAFRKGYSAVELERDPAMKNLRADPRFVQLQKGGENR
jgi:serine/threonine-protein kinase